MIGRWGRRHSVAAVLDDGAVPADITIAPASQPELEPSKHDDLLIGRWIGFANVQRQTLDALSTELGRTSTLIEDSTLDLSRRFRELAETSSEQSSRVDAIVAMAGFVEIDGDRVPLEDVVNGMQAMIAEMIANVVTVSKSAMNLVYVLDDVGKDVADLGKSLTEIDTINRQTNLLALNAAVEAARSGQASGEMGIVATEIRNLSSATTTLAAQMHSKVKAVTKGVCDGHDILRQIATKDMTPQMEAKEQIDLTMGSLVSQTRRFQGVLEGTASSSEGMSQVIGRMVTGMQFQDLTKQRLEHVIDGMTVITGGLDELADRSRALLPEGFEVPLPQEWLDTLFERFTLSEMRQRFVRHLMLEGTALDEHGALDAGQDVAEDGGGDIELF